jgi:hypothetical protein
VAQCQMRRISLADGGILVKGGSTVVGSSSGAVLHVCVGVRRAPQHQKGRRKLAAEGLT